MEYTMKVQLFSVLLICLLIISCEKQPDDIASEPVVIEKEEEGTEKGLEIASEEEPAGKKSMIEEETDTAETPGPEEFEETGTRKDQNREYLFTAEITAPEHDTDESAISVRKIHFESDGTDIMITLITSEDIAEFLDRTKSATPLIEFMLDTDNNDSTGGTTYHESRPGFEYLSRIYAGIKYTMGTFSIEGSLDELEIKGFLSTYDIAQYQGNGKKEAFPEIIRDPSDSKQLSLSELWDNTIRIKIPYDTLNLYSQKTIRIASRTIPGSSAGSSEHSLPDIIFTLR